MPRKSLFLTLSLPLFLRNIKKRLFVELFIEISKQNPENSNAAIEMLSVVESNRSQGKLFYF